jgi:hypothetical protein
MGPLLGKAGSFVYASLLVVGLADVGQLAVLLNDMVDV